MKQWLPIDRDADDLLRVEIDLDVVEPLRRQIAEAQGGGQGREFCRETNALAPQVRVFLFQHGHTAGQT